ncbi:hypothetical protein CCACVL1_18914 [Corchorus capsularis]|uniref:Prolamin-like domain-containing protein n=1 Tax=Corchorus capsularis TaxID=210143 RepID=A0A1R3HJB2_COCAP|nr:hypothetical protein CCACVL1_18914 [Corchorus capsularis]
MASIVRIIFLAFLLTTLLFLANARPMDPNPTSSRRSSTSLSLVARLKLDEEPTGCWDSLIELQSCTGEIIMFFLNGETELGHSCCQAIRTISNHCWPSMIGALGFTTEETHVLEGYCDHEQNSPPSIGPNNIN